MAGPAPMLTLTERQFQSQVIAAARLYGWWVYHTHDSRRSQAGFPDLVMIRKGKILFVELKSHKGRLTDEQKKVLAMLKAAGLTTYVWRPSDWLRAIEILSGGPPR